MLPRPKTSKDVWVFTFVASLFSVAITVIAVPLTFELPNLVPDLIKCAAIALMCSVPTGWVLCNEMRKNENLNEMLVTLVNRDRLTDAATRDYFFHRMAEKPDSYGVSLMVDIDHFKTVNDVHGHLVGDQVIRRVAENLRSAVREEDIVCRFGGEEFIIFLAHHGSEEGAIVAERMRQSIADDVIRFQDIALSVTVSIGGSLKDRLTDINQSIQKADEALYQAKASGRNKAIFAPSVAA